MLFAKKNEYGKIVMLFSFVLLVSYHIFIFLIKLINFLGMLYFSVKKMAFFNRNPLSYRICELSTYDRKMCFRLTQITFLFAVSN